MTSLAYVRRAEPADANAIASILLAAWRERFGNVWPPEVWRDVEPGELQRAWSEALSEARTSITPVTGIVPLVALSESEVVGCALWETDGEGSAELSMWEVHPDFRRYGHASRLITAVADTAADAGIRELRWWATDHEHSRGEFLEGMGWALDGATRTVETSGFAMKQVRWVTTL